MKLRFHSVAILLAFMMVGAASPTKAPAQAPANRPDVARLLEEARAAMGRRDPQAALTAFNAAVAADPNNLEAHWTRAGFLSSVIDIASDENSRQNARNLARSDYNFIIANAPESILAGVARDALAQLEGKQVLRDKEYACSETVQKDNSTGYLHFMAKRYSEAREYYQKSVDGCPENGLFWIQLGDTYFAIGDLRKARELFTEGLKRNPWDRSGHRFLSDTEARLGNPTAAYNHAVLAVISDPTYEAGWAFLRESRSASKGNGGVCPISGPPSHSIRKGSTILFFPSITKSFRTTKLCSGWEWGSPRSPNWAAT